MGAVDGSCGTGRARGLKPELLLPLSVKERVLGIMSLGPKQSEEPFSATDLRLLDSVAAHTGLALENGRLTEAIKTEARAREKQNRDLERARSAGAAVPAGAHPAIPGSITRALAGRRSAWVAITTTSFRCRNGGLGIAIGDVFGGSRRLC